MLADAMEGAERIRRIVGDLKHFARQRGDDAGPFEPNEAIRAAVALVTPATKQSVVIETELSPGSLVQGDSRRLGQVILNLVLNAAQAVATHRSAGAPSGKVLVRSGAVNDTAMFVDVIDDGPGISAEVQAKIFEPFFTTKPVGEGTGLGLAVSREIVATMGGTLSVSSQPGKGATFRVLLPTLPDAHEASPRREQRAAVEQAPQPLPEAEAGTEHRRLRVLLVDDEVLVTQTLERALPDLEVAVANDTTSAIARCRADRFDAVVCDVMMPGGGGPAIHRALEESSPELAARMVFITGGATSIEAADFLERVAAPVLQKPVGLALLRAALSRVAAASRVSRVQARSAGEGGLESDDERAS